MTWRRHFRDSIGGVTNCHISMSERVDIELKGSIMGGLSLAHWAIVALVAILLLGGGRFSRMALDVAKGLKSFKKELGEEHEAAGTLSDRSK